LTQPEQVGTAYAQGKVPPKGQAADVPIGADPNVDEFNPTVAANPVNTNNLVAGSEYNTNTINSCVVYTSSDGGQTWTDPFTMPLLSEISQCSNPVVAYAPDGSRVYYVYMDMKSTFEYVGEDWRNTFDGDILVSTSNDNGSTWTAPVVALDGEESSFLYDTEAGEYIDVQEGYEFDRPWISTPQDAAEKNWVYITATRLDHKVDSPTACFHINFVSSDDGGSTWAEPVSLDQSTGSCDDFYGMLVHGARPAGGMGGNVLAAWYHSGSDGMGVGEFEIRTRYSNDHGSTWNDIVTVVTDSHEIPLWWIVGPFVRQSGAMFPDVEIDGKGGAHIAYVHDPYRPVEGADEAENGDIRYTTSTGTPYEDWSAPVTVNDDEMMRTQGWPALETQMIKKKVYVYLMWADFRLSPDGTPAVFYDIFAARKRAGSSKWSANWRVSDASSYVEWGYFGDYFDLTANKDLVYGVWIDRRDVTDPYEMEDDVFGSWLLPRR